MFLKKLSHHGDPEDFFNFIFCVLRALRGSVNNLFGSGSSRLD